MPQDEESMLREPQHENVKSLNIEEMEEILIKKALKNIVEIFLWRRKIWDYRERRCIEEWRNLNYKWVVS
jgi:hypothetical protein